MAYLINLIIRLFRKIRVLSCITLYKLEYGKKLNIDYSLYFQKGFSLVIEGKNSNLYIGKNVFFNSFCSVNVLGSVLIGERSIFGENVRIYDHNHKYSEADVPIAEQGYKIDGISIGKNCWIGSNVVILKGVTIGNHVVIGAGCIIYKDVPDDTVVVCRQNQLVKKIKK